MNKIIKMWEKAFDELSPCFSVWCDPCGWKGRRNNGVLFVLGMDYPYEYDPRDRIAYNCPGCGRLFQSRADRDSIIQRFRWDMDHAYGFGRDERVFPCCCDPQPLVRTTEEPEIKMSLMGDTAFLSDQMWFRITAPVRCNGCHAEGKVALLERHTNRSLDMAGWWGR